MIELPTTLLALPTAFVVSLVASLGGLSGAFLLLPLQVGVLGLAGPGVSATNHLFNTIAIPGGAGSMVRRGRVVRPLVLLMVGGSVPGAVLGAWIRTRHLAEPGAFRLFAGAVMAAIAILLLARIPARWRAEAAPDPAHPVQVRVVALSWRRLCLAVGGEQFVLSPLVLLGLSLGAGLIGGAYGIGGGALLAPLLIAVFRLPVHATAGATLIGTWTTSAVAVLSYLALPAVPGAASAAPDWSLGLLLGLGGLAGIWCGCQLRPRLRSSWIELVLGLLVLGVAISYLFVV